MRLGRIRTQELPDPLDETRRRRIAAVRTTAWTEVPETRLVARGRFTVDSETDIVYVPLRGAIFREDGTLVLDDARRDIVYAITATGGLTILEPSTVAKTWSEFVERGARKAAKARA